MDKWQKENKFKWKDDGHGDALRAGGLYDRVERLGAFPITASLFSQV